MSTETQTHTCYTPCHLARLLQISPWVCDTRSWLVGRGSGMAWTPDRTPHTRGRRARIRTSSGQGCTPGSPWDEKAEGWQRSTNSKKRKPSYVCYFSQKYQLFKCVRCLQSEMLNHLVLVRSFRARVCIYVRFTIKQVVAHDRKIQTFSVHELCTKRANISTILP